MPTPRTDETEQQFFERCIPQVIDEGEAENPAQAVAICDSKWRDFNANLAVPYNFRTNRSLRRDPTRTVTLRRQFAIDLRKRFRRVRSLIIETVDDNDAFGLNRELGFQIEQASPAVHQDLVPSGPLPPPPPGAKAKDRFVFSTVAEAVEEFAEWLGFAVEREILEVYEAEAAARIGQARRPWDRVYYRTAYAKGVSQADSKLTQAGFTIDQPSTAKWINQNVLRQPRHVGSLKLIYTRSFSELEGITGAMEQQIRRQLAGGFSQGLGPRQIARQLADRVDKVGIHRANLLARTEIVNAHAEATLNRFEDFGVEEVQGFAEFATAGDKRVCSKCRGIESADSYGRGAGIYPIGRARGLIPVHPQCRCSWWPVIPE